MFTLMCITSNDPFHKLTIYAFTVNPNSSFFYVKILININVDRWN